MVATRWQPTCLHDSPPASLSPLPQSGSAAWGCPRPSCLSCFWTVRWCGPSGRSAQESHHQDGSSPPARCNTSPAGEHVWTHLNTLQPPRLLSAEVVILNLWDHRCCWTNLNLLDVLRHHFCHVFSKRCQLVVGDGIFGPDGGCTEWISGFKIFMTSQLYIRDKCSYFWCFLLSVNSRTRHSLVMSGQLDILFKKFEPLKIEASMSHWSGLQEPDNF